MCHRRTQIAHILGVQAGGAINHALNHWNGLRCFSAVAPRARENVWVEVGWFWGYRGRSKLPLLTKGAVTIPSDLGNVEHYPYNDLSECEQWITRFIAKLRSACDV
jgi:predicted nucleotide-binding protein